MERKQMTDYELDFRSWDGKDRKPVFFSAEEQEVQLFKLNFHTLLEGSKILTFEIGCGIGYRGRADNAYLLEVFLAQLPFRGTLLGPSGHTQCHDDRTLWIDYSVHYPRNVAMHANVIRLIQGLGNAMGRPSLLRESYGYLTVTQETYVKSKKGVWFSFGDYLVKQACGLWEE